MLLYGLPFSAPTCVLISHGKVAKVAKNAQALAEYLSTALENKNVTYFCSDVRLDILPAYLQSHDITINEVEAYKTMLSPEKLDDSVTGVLFYSPSGIESYLTENNADKVAFCIGETTAKEARKHFENVQVAQLPSVDSVLELVNSHFTSN